MNDLFRFLMLRPANVTASKDVKKLRPSFVDSGVSHEVARQAARNFVEKKSILLSPDDLKLASVALAVTSAVGLASISAKDVSAIVKKETGKAIADVVALPEFDSEEQRLADSLVAMWLLSDSSGGDAPGLAKLAQGYDAIRLAASGHDSISLRVLSIDGFNQRGSNRVPPSREEVTSPTSPSKEYRDAHTALQNLDGAIAKLKTLSATGFHTGGISSESQRAQFERLDARLAALEKPAGEAAKPVGTAASPAVTRPWMLSANAISSLPQTVQQTLSEAGIDPHTQSLPVILNALHAKRIEHLKTIEKAKMPENLVIAQVGNSFVRTNPGG